MPILLPYSLEGCTCLLNTLSLPDTFPLTLLIGRVPGCVCLAHTHTLSCVDTFPLPFFTDRVCKPGTHTHTLDLAQRLPSMWMMTFAYQEAMFRRINHKANNYNKVKCIYLYILIQASRKGRRFGSNTKTIFSPPCQASSVLPWACWLQACSHRQHETPPNQLEKTQ